MNEVAQMFAGGAESEVTGVLAEWPAQALADLLDVPCPNFAAGEPLPLGWHWLYLLEHPRQSDLGRDGHPAFNELPAQAAAGLRRMWAGGALTRLEPLLVGQRIIRRSRVAEMTHKHGRSGDLLFLRVEHEFIQRGVVALRERQDLVYRQPSDAERSADPMSPRIDVDMPLQDGDWAIPVSPTLLFRFSALTYNAHRIHYDRDYCRTVEGYPGLVTHGPLQALAMAESMRFNPAIDRLAPATFDYRLVAPLFDHQGLVVRCDLGAGQAPAQVRTEARDRSGRRTARGTYRLL